MGEQPGNNQERAAQITALIDAFRKAGPGKDWYITAGIQTLQDVRGLIQVVIDYDDFTPEIDPHCEHDMGRIVWEQEKTYFKFDYYDQQLQYWCDPFSPECRRVLTLMLTEEY